MDNPLDLACYILYFYLFTGNEIAIEFMFELYVLLKSPPIPEWGFHVTVCFQSLIINLTD